jgi:hypothetical protein
MISLTRGNIGLFTFGELITVWASLFSIWRREKAAELETTYF